ncbi:MAG: lactonase family protein [Treponema sp.]|jgi:6-phosphogluconolactonase|nr:lactonase family protein [Treponema sp.]
MSLINGFIGTYTDGPLGRAKGIYSFTLNKNGAVENLALAVECVNPAYLTLSPSKKWLYVVNETSEGMVSAYNLEAEKPRFLNQKPSNGVSPCHIVINNAATHAFVANYLSGTLCALPLEPNGSLGEPTQLIQFTGGGPNKERQEASHAHFFMLDQSNTHGFACDLGADRLMGFRLSPNQAREPLAPLPPYNARPGSGPRHGVFHPNGDIAYIAYELDSTVDTLRYDGQGGFECLQTLSTLPPAFQRFNAVAAIKLSPDASHLYVSNRGHDSIAVYKLNANKTLTFMDILPSGGKNPRDFAIDPSGNFLLACHQDSDNLVVFHIDRDTGLFTKAGEYPIPSGVCILLY